MKGTPINSQPKALIEDVLELTPVLGLGPVILHPRPPRSSKTAATNKNPQDTFTNTNPLWRPPGNRGIFGGILIAQTLAAAQKTITDDFLARSMHCYFVLAGDGEKPILYHVDRVADTPEYLIRSVSAKQGDRLIFSAMMNFTKATENHIRKPDYAIPPPNVDPPVDVESGWDTDRPFQSLEATIERMLIVIFACSCLNVTKTIQKTPQDRKIRKSDNGRVPGEGYPPLEAKGLTSGRWHISQIASSLEPCTASTPCADFPRRLRYGG